MTAPRRFADCPANADMDTRTPHRQGTLMQDSRLIHCVQIVVRELEHKRTLHAHLAHHAHAPAAREVARFVAAAYTDAIESFQRAERAERQ